MLSRVKISAYIQFSKQETKVIFSDNTIQSVRELKER